MRIARTSYIIGLLFLAPVLFGGCKQFRGTKLEKFYHNTTARFNGYFNAKEKMKEAEHNIFVTYTDNFNNILEVFPSTTEKTASGFSADMETVKTKASKVIQKHDISKWVDDCYFLIAKSNFYKRDYFAAIEVFSFVVEKYRKSEPAQESLLWLVRCYLEQNKLEEAAAMIANIKNNVKLAPQFVPYFQLVQASYHIKSGGAGHYIEAADLMEKALTKIDGKRYRTRYMYILAQLHQRLGNNKQAAEYYLKVIKRNPVYELSFQSKIGLADVSANPREVKGYLEKLTKDDKNITYFDQIYYVLARTEQRQGNTDAAINYLKESVKASKTNNNQKALSFLMLGDIYFAKPVYPLAKAYYDSAGRFIGNDFPNADKFRTRQAVLGDLINNLIIIQREDSLLRLSYMDSATLRRHIDNMVEMEKERARNAELQAEEQRFMQQHQQQMEIARPGDQIGVKGGKYWSSEFAIRSGQQEFKAKWGNRGNHDNWRTVRTPGSSSPTPPHIPKGTEDIKVEVGQPDTPINAEKFHGFNDANVPAALQKYYQFIPRTSSQRNLANRRLEEALFNSGNIYYAKLDDRQKATETFEELLKRYPEGNNAGGAAYNLWRLYKDKNDKEKQEYYEKYVCTKFPGSVYCRIITDPQGLPDRRTNAELDKLYSEGYAEFQRGNCTGLSDKAAEAKRSYEKNPYKGRFEYLMLLCRGKSDSTFALVDSLRTFVNRYPGDEITPQAMGMIKFLESKQTARKSKNPEVPEQNRENAAPQTEYKVNAAEPHQFVIVIPQTALSRIVTTQLTQFNEKNRPTEQHRVSSYLLNDGKNQLIVVEGFANAAEAMQYMQALDKEPGFYSNMSLPSHQEVIISDTNYKTLFKSRDLQGYLNFFKKNYDR